MSLPEHALHLPGLLKKREGRSTQDTTTQPSTIPTFSEASAELNRAIVSGPTGEQLDDKLQIASLSQEIEQLQHQRSSITRRHLLLGTAALVAEATFLYMTRPDTQVISSQKLVSETAETTASTLNPESQLPENPLQAVDYLWRIAVPYQKSTMDIEITTFSEGLEDQSSLRVDIGSFNPTQPVFTGPDQKIYMYTYAIPTTDDGGVMVELNADTPAADEPFTSNEAINLGSHIATAGERTGSILMEEIVEDEERLIPLAVEVLTEGEKLLPRDTVAHLWIPSLPYPGQSIITTERIGAVLSLEQLAQANGMSSEIPYVTGRLIYRAGLAQDIKGQIPPDHLLAYATFNEITTEYTKAGYFQNAGGDIQDGDIVTYPPFLEQLKVKSYDTMFTKGGRTSEVDQLLEPTDIFAQMYTISSTEALFAGFENWFDNPDNTISQRIFNLPFWQAFYQLTSALQSGTERTNAQLRVHEFLSRHDALPNTERPSSLQS